jgi:NADP-dependent 3-hydroxy acid dehydrogenase YdfG
MGPLDGRAAVITGASAGIGEAVARRLAARGAGVVLNARRGDRIEALAQSIQAAGGRAVCVPGDAADEGVIGAMLAACERELGRACDLAVVNAGRGLSGSVMTSDPAQWEEMIRINLLGAARLMRAAGAVMAAGAAKEAWPGRARDIVVLGSTVGRHISPFSSMYGSTKFAVNSLAEAQRRELGPKGVRVSLIEPGIVRSEFQGVAGYDAKVFGELMDRVGPVLEADDIAQLVETVVGLPARVHLSDTVIRSTRQEYP